MSCDINVEAKTEDLKEVAIALMNKISDGISWAVEKRTPHKIAIDEYITAIRDNRDLNPQIKAVLTYNAKRDIRRWSNVSSICELAAEKLLATANPNKIDEEWRNLFNSYAENISTEKMQEIWAFVLAQECNEPETVPKALLNTLYSMGKHEAECFERLGSFCIRLVDAEGNKGNAIPLIIFTKINDYYYNHDVGLDTLHTLETLGLINMDLSPLGGISTSVTSSLAIEYFDENINVSDVRLNDGNLSVGSVSLSFIGEALMKIIIPEKVDGFFEEVAVPYFKNPSKYIKDAFSS